MRYWIIISVLILFSPMRVAAEDLVVHGFVYHNVEKEKVMPGFEIWAEGANREKTTDSGEFEFKFTGNKIGDQVRFQIPDEGYELVNFKEIQPYTLPSNAESQRLKVYVCKIKECDRQRRIYYKIVSYDELDRRISTLKEDSLHRESEVTALTNQVNDARAKEKQFLEEFALFRQQYAQQVEQLKKSGSYLMIHHIEGDLPSTRILAGVEAFAASQSGHTGAGGLINFEFLMPTISGVIGGLSFPIFEYGWVGISYDREYSVLKNQSPLKFDENNSFKFYDVAAKKYFHLGPSFQPFVGGALGRSFETEDQGAKGYWYHNIMGGVEYSTKNIWTSVEIRYGRYELSEREVTFNPFGNGIDTYEHSRHNIFFVGVSVSLDLL